MLNCTAGPFRVKAESDGQNQGATFRVSLPIALTATIEPAEPQVLNLAGSAATLLDGLKILVVDDEPDSRDVVQAILTRFGGQVKCTESVKEAIRAFQEWSPDLLVTDIGMPNEDGYCLIKKLRRLRSKRAKEIPAIALTGYAAEKDIETAIAAGFNMHIAKPVEPAELSTAVAKLLASHRSRKR